MQKDAETGYDELLLLCPNTEEYANKVKAFIDRVEEYAKEAENVDDAFVDRCKYLAHGAVDEIFDYLWEDYAHRLVNAVHDGTDIDESGYITEQIKLFG